MEIFQFNYPISSLSKADVQALYASSICKKSALTSTFFARIIAASSAFSLSRSPSNYFSK
ncbi:MAG: hypothetical protein EOP33_08165 [Rickettsiaceae bacterium]|nr:MAG: hypothetical protein EOP33_08165 [Rickettsiaceae bacterium]